MPLLKHYHRDMLGRIIKHGDYVAWANKDYGKTLTFGNVIGTMPKKVLLQIPLEENRITRAYPQNMMVITDQILANISGNVGAGLRQEQKEGDTNGTSD